jgi:type I restriction enzyme S subunit
MLPNFWSYKTVLSFKHPIDQTVQTGPFGAQLHSDDYVDEGVPFILIKNIKDGTIDPEGMPCITHADARRLANYVLQKNDIVFSRVGRVGSCFLVEDEHIGWVISGQLLRLRLDLSNLDPHFLIHWIRSEYVERHIGNESVGSTRQSINSNILSNMPIPNIPLVEQRHITYILDTFDTTIRQTEAIIAKLQQMKQGLLHDLLTRGIDANGQLRPPVEQASHLYKESPLGWIPMEWEVGALSDVADVARGKFTHRPRNDPAFYGGSYPFIQTGDVAAALGGIVTTYSQTLSTRGTKVSQEFPTGTIAITIAANIADTAILGNPMYFPDSVVGAVVGQNSNCRFIELCIRSAKHRLESRAPQSAQKNINLQDLRPLQIPIPDIKEQNHIAGCYESIQTRIEKEQSSLIKYKNQKFALMDDLLTGRVRVTALLSGEIPASKELARKSA